MESKGFDVLKSIGLNIWVWGVATDEVSYSDGFWGVLGFSSKDSLTFNKLSDFENRIHSNELFEFLEELNCCLKNGNTLKLEVRIRNHDMEYQWCLITGRYLSEEGHFYGNLVDIDSYRKVKENLSKEHSFRQALIDNIPFGIITLDISGNIASINEFGKQKLNLDAIPKNMESILDSSQLEECRNYFNEKLIHSINACYKVLLQCDAHEEWKFYEWKVGVEKDLVFPAHISIKPMLNKWKSTLGFLVILHDLTTQKKMDLQLSMAQKWESVGQLAAGIAHEINTPSQYIGDNLSFIEDSLPDLFGCIDRLQNLVPLSEKKQAEEIVEELDIEYLKKELYKANKQSLEGVSRIAKIVNSMKEFSHPSQDERSVVDVNRLIKNAIILSKGSHKYVANVCFSPEVETFKINLYVDEMNQVLLNLIVNSSHAIQESMEKQIATKHIEKGDINISTYVEDDFCCIKVEDTGCGISEENLSKIFNPFFTTKDVGKGTGQGLAIVYRIIVEKHGGKVFVESVLDKGTMLLLKLPLGEN